VSNGAPSTSISRLFHVRTGTQCIVAYEDHLVIINLIKGDMHISNTPS
jgi:hypothetical protein